MKHLNNILSFILIVFLVGACTPDEYNLGDTDIQPEELVEGIAYTITHDSENPNIVYLTSLMGSEYTPLWNHPQGRSQDKVVTLKIPFAGTYEVQFGVQTRGGYVYGETVTFDVDQMYAGFIEDELWTLVSGGQGKSKTWYLDLDGEQTARFFGGPIWFFTDTYEWDNLHNAAGDNYIDADVWDAKSAILPNLQESGEAVWYWSADWAGNQWMCDAADFGTMTFDLIGGANLTVDQTAYSTTIGGGAVQNGSYMLDTEKHTIKFTDALPVHDENRDAGVTSATEFRILYASEDFLQILVVPEGACYNYISKDFRDNWTPEEEGDPEPELPEGWQDDISTVTSTSIKWVLSPETPFNWANLDGSLMNEGWVSADTYADWTGMNADVPATYADFSLTINASNNSVAMILPDGTESEGTYELDEKGIYTFTGVKPEFNICSWVNLSTTAENQWRILSIEKDALGAVSGMWVGALAADKPEYMCYKLIPEVGGGGEDASLAIKEILTSQVWKLDSERTYDVATSWGAEQGPVIFSDFSTWAWNPQAGEHYASGEAGVDYGTMQFNMDGTVTVNQRKRVYTYVDGDTGETMERHGSPEEGDVLDSEEVVSLTGSWSIDIDNNKLLMTVGAVHPWTTDYYVLNWGDLDIYKIENNVLILKAMRDAERSGEDAFAMAYVFVPEN